MGSDGNVKSFGLAGERRVPPDHGLDITDILDPEHDESGRGIQHHRRSHSGSQRRSEVFGLFVAGDRSFALPCDGWIFPDRFHRFTLHLHQSVRICAVNFVLDRKSCDWEHDVRSWTGCTIDLARETLHLFLFNMCGLFQVQTSASPPVVNQLRLFVPANLLPSQRSQRRVSLYFAVFYRNLIKKKLLTIYIYFYYYYLKPLLPSKYSLFL